MTATTILFVGDVVGGLGRRALLGSLPGLRERHRPDFVVNGENAAGGLGITPKIADEMFDSGVDAITLGNHAYRHNEVFEYLDSEKPIVRPANYLAAQPGRGWCVVAKDGVELAVLNLSGNVFLKAGRPMLPTADAELEKIAREQPDHILVDVHAEATSEKVAAGLALDGEVTAVVGTHTHVPTADARVLPGGTAFISDVGMTGPRDGVIGVKADQAIASLRTQMNTRFETAEGDPWINAVVIRATQSLKADSIEQVLVPWQAPQR